MNSSKTDAKSFATPIVEPSSDVLVSIIMPIYNRERFLPEAIASIRAQRYQYWELFIVDDGSSDNSVALLATLTAEIADRVTVIQQENQGPAAARNNGIRRASGELLAFFDSDDLWLPHHLSDCIKAFFNHPEVSWVYAACERVQYDTGECLQESTFYTDGVPNKLFSIADRQADGVHVLDTEKAILLQLNQGLDNGLQNSVLRRQILDAHLIPDFRVGEDRLFIIMALKSGFKMAFIDAIHVRYHVHDENISDTNKNEDNFGKRIGALERLIHAKKQLPSLVSFNPDELKVFRTQLSKELFWELGYSLYQRSGDYDQAINAYWQGLGLQPLTLRYYKTLLIAYAKRLFA